MANRNLLIQFKDRIVPFFLYSNIWIGLAALAMVFQTEYLWLQGQIKWSTYHLFVFCATLFVYAAHRLLALSRLNKSNWQERFTYIARAQQYILTYAIISGFITLVVFFFLDAATQVLLIMPGIISLAYIFPVLKGGKRVRDVHFIKIFLIALVWAWITVTIPASVDDVIFENQAIAIFWERAFFIFAITLPFDVRDLLLDADQDVLTLPRVLGARGTRTLAGIALLLSLILAIYNLGYVYTPLVWSGLVLSLLIAYYLIYHAHEKQPDYYFTGYLDGTMILQFLLVFLAGQA